MTSSMTADPMTSEVTNASDLDLLAEREDSDPYYDQAGIYFWGELGVELTVYLLTFLIGCFGNFMILVIVFCNRSMRSVTNIFLASLAATDLLLICFCIPVKIVKLFSFVWTMGAFTCLALHYVQTVVAMSSVLTLTAISIERYYVVIHPMKAQYVCTRSRARRIVLVVWLLSLLLASPVLFAQGHMPVGVPPVGYWCMRKVDNPVLWISCEVYLLVVLLVAPGIVMMTTYTSIVLEVSKVMLNRQALTADSATAVSGSELNQADRIRNRRMSGIGRTRSVEDQAALKQLVRMMVIVVLLFLLCWAPFLIFNTLQSVGVFPVSVPGIQKHLRTAFELLAYSNSCINPIVYGFTSASFRESFVRVLCGDRCSGPAAGTSSKNSSTRRATFNGSSRQTGSLNKQQI